MTVHGVRVRVRPGSNDVVVLLREAAGEQRAVPIMIGPHEGLSIASAQKGAKSPRPGPYELVLAVMAAARIELERVEVTSLEGGIFRAELVLSNGTRIDSRSSDAISLALRAKVEIYCAEEIVEEAGIELEPDLNEQAMYLTQSMDTEAEVAEFRSFLEDIDPADFGNPEE